jgi:hypothetical protein
MKADPTGSKEYFRSAATAASHRNSGSHSYYSNDNDVGITIVDFRANALRRSRGSSSSSAVSYPSRLLNTLRGVVGDVLATYHRAIQKYPLRTKVHTYIHILAHRLITLPPTVHLPCSSATTLFYVVRASTVVFMNCKCTCLFICLS